MMSPDNKAVMCQNLLSDCLRTLLSCARVAALLAAIAISLNALLTVAAETEPADFVGRQVCSGCHQQEDALWQGSDHDWAMRVADSSSVLGDFNEVTFDHYGEQTRFSVRDGQYWVTTDNASGEQQDFRVEYTFGFYPLQQYLLATGGGHLQALSVSWDSRPADEGGQRWFHLYPDEPIPFNDALHWTGPYQNWNGRCAECHSTNLQRNYNPADNTFATRWSEINVSCEACHGPGSRHVSLMTAKGQTSGKTVTAASHQSEADHHGFDRSLDPVGQWLFSDTAATAHNAEAAATRSDQLSACGSCHARRSLLGNLSLRGRQNLPDSFDQKHRLQLIEQPLYYGDGQIRDEVYELGSFMQSKMHQNGVVCSNCHEPHSLKLRAEGNNVCAQCHRPDVFDRPAHHHHPAGSTGAQCVSCHMPQTTYMVVDPRRDHSLRIPRPDLSVRYGTPNACTQCHTEQSADWAGDAVEQWLRASGKSRQWHYSDDLLPALNGAEDAGARLMKLAMLNRLPALIQASAVAALADHLSPQALLVAQTQLHHRDPLVRAAAVGVLAALPPEQRWQDLRPLLNDPSKQVRLAVAEHSVDADVSGSPAAERARWQALQQEYQAYLQQHLYAASGQMALGVYRLRQGDLPAAQAAYQQALTLDSSFLGGYLNLADLYRQTGEENKAEAILRRGLKALPQAPALYHALGLSQVRSKHYEAALQSLASAAQLAPDHAHYGYVYGLILQQLGQEEAAAAEWRRVLQQHPGDSEVLTVLFIHSQRKGDQQQMLAYAERLLAQAPADARWQQIVQQLQQSMRTH